jgi:hypothetical protein
MEEREVSYVYWRLRHYSGRSVSVRGIHLGRQRLPQSNSDSSSGEVGTLTGRAAASMTRAVSDYEVIVIDEESLRALVVAEAELSETIMRAYILRRVAFIQGQHAGVVANGSTASAPTLHLRHFQRSALGLLRCCRRRQDKRTPDTLWRNGRPRGRGCRDRHS